MLNKKKFKKSPKGADARRGNQEKRSTSINTKTKTPFLGKNKNKKSKGKFPVEKKKNNVIKTSVENSRNADDNENYQGTDKEDEISGKKWFEEFLDVKGEEATPEIKYTALKKEAGHFFEREISEHFGKQPKTIPRSDFAWIRTVIQKGTFSDKIAALVLLIQDDPVVNFANLRNLVSMVKVGKNKDFFMAMDTLVELFLDTLLPPNRKLKLFTQQPLSVIEKLASNDQERRRRLLLLWYFEEQLKNQYTAFLAALNDAAHDTVDANKERAIVVMNKLLQGHPEQEATLLANIVNKLGDPSHKIGSKVIYTLTQLLDAHPLMKGVVMEEVEKVIFRPNMSRRAQYYSICFLNQFSFDSADSQLASNLISIYFSLFKACIKTGEIDSRMMSALLTGVSRAYPYAKRECTILNDHINTVYKVVHLSSANVAIHALALLSLVVGDEVSDRFMTVLYKKIREPSMFNAAHHAMFLSLIFKAIKRDSNDSRACAFIKRLLQMCIHLPVPIICGILILISETLHRRKGLRLKMVEEIKQDPGLKEEDDGEETYRDDTEELKLEENSDPKQEISSWYHAGNKPSQGLSPGDQYNPFQRNPLHAEGEKALPVELVELSRHYHPTVSLFSQNILQGSKINYSGDPLQDFTLIRFLDKFVFKNPKNVNSSEQRVTTFSRFSRKKFYNSVGLKRLRVNTEEFLKSDEKTIPVDEKYLYNYLKEKAEIKKEDSEDGDSDVESVGDEEFEKILGRVAASQGDLDFMNEIGSLPEKSKKNKAKKGAESDSEEASELENSEEYELDGSGDGSDLESTAEDFDGDELDDLSDDEEMESDDDEELPAGKNTKQKNKAQKRKSSGLFASAEEFADILDEDRGFKAGTSAALSNKDNAAIKQLEWESNRDVSSSRGGRQKFPKSSKRNNFKRKSKQSNDTPRKRQKK